MLLFLRFLYKVLVEFFFISDGHELVAVVIDPTAFCGPIQC